MNFLLTGIVFMPLLGAVLILFIPKQKEETIRRTALIFSTLALGLSLALYANYPQGASGIGFQEGPYPWIPNIGVSYFVGVDGISLPLIVLTTLLTVLCLLYSWTITLRVKEYFFLFLLLETGMLGTFSALDYFLFYIFWEVSLVPMYFLIGIWGGPRREYAAIKFFLYTLVGSVAMLLAILAIYFDVGRTTGNYTFSILELAKAHPFAGNMLWQSLCFIGFFLAFAIKVPLFPFHTWLPDAHVEAPTAGSVILAGILLKMGGYGFFRISLPTFPGAAYSFSGFIAILAFISIVYGALVAMAQTDFKKMIANSSVNHMGYVMLAVAAAAYGAKTGAGSDAIKVALNGAMLQMISHGLITGALFFLVGVVYDRTHSRDLNSFGGLGAIVPVYAGVLTLFSLASLGLPGMSGFVSEFLIFLGSFTVYFGTATLWLVGLSVLGVVVTAAFFLWMIQRVLLGNLNPKYQNLTDMDRREVVSLLPLAVLTIAIGIFPGMLIKLTDPAVGQMLSLMK